MLLVSLPLALVTSSAFAHPSRTAADGCRYCRTNCAKWGEVAGARHCHGQKSQRPTPAPRYRQNMQLPARQPHATQECIRKTPTEIRDSTPRVIDADTLQVAGQKVRLQGIDALESAQFCRQPTGRSYLCGDRATQALRERIGTGTVACKVKGRDRYNRALGVCYTADGTDLNGWLVSQGYALTYRRYSTTYVPQENQAKAARVGIWAGEFVQPWNWRRGERLN